MEFRSLGTSVSFVLKLLLACWIDPLAQRGGKLAILDGAIDDAQMYTSNGFTAVCMEGCFIPNHNYFNPITIYKSSPL